MILCQRAREVEELGELHVRMRHKLIKLHWQTKRIWKMWENSYFPFISMLISEFIVVHLLHVSYEEEIDGQLRGRETLNEKGRGLTKNSHNQK